MPITLVGGNYISRSDSLGLFMNDSLHSACNVLITKYPAWAVLRASAHIAVYNIESTRGLKPSTMTACGYPSQICEVNPLRLLPRRFSQEGRFGNVFERPSAGV